MAQYRAKGPDGRMYKFDGPPGLTDRDAAFFLNQFLGSAPEAPLFEPTLGPAPGPAPQTGFIPSIKRSAMQTGVLFGDVLPAMLGRAVGADEYANRQLAEAAASQKEIQERFPAAVPSFTDIKGVGDAVTYITEAVGEAIPSLLPSLFTGGAAALLARPAMTAAMQAAEGVAAREVARATASGALTDATLQGIRKAALDEGVKAAQRTALKYQAVGALTGSAAQNIPEVYQNILQETGKEDIGAALVAGGFNSVLDAILPVQLLRKVGTAGIPPQEIIGAWYKRGAVGLGKGFFTEGGTEAVQEMSSAAAEAFVANNPNFFTAENFVRFVNAGLKGGIGGGVITGASDVVFGRAAEKPQPPIKLDERSLLGGTFSEEEDVAEPFELTGGAGAGVAGVPGARPPAGRPVTTQPDGMVSTPADVGQPPAREGTQSGAVEATALIRAQEDLEDFDPLINPDKPPYEGAKKRNGLWTSRDGKFSVVPAGGYGSIVLPNDAADFVMQNGFGTSHLNRFLGEAIMDAKRGLPIDRHFSKLRAEFQELEILDEANQAELARIEKTVKDVFAAPPAAAGEGTQSGAVARLEDFSRQYNDLRQEANELLSITSPTQADGRRLLLVNRDLASIVDANADLIGSKALVDQLKNPMFDGTRVLTDLQIAASQVPTGQARGMRGDLFGGRKDVLDLTNRALAIGRGDPQKSVQYLQEQLQRFRDRVAANINNGIWGRTNAPQVGLTPEEGFDNPKKVAELYLQQEEQRTAEAIAAVQSKGPARGMQGDLFGALPPTPSPRSQLVSELKQAAAEVQQEERAAAEPEFGSDEGIVEEPVREETRPAVSQKERVVAPAVDTERLLQTEEGQAIQGFFDVIEPATESPVEREKYQSPKNAAQAALLEYDIAAPGETTTEGGLAALRYLANRVGGMEAFQQLVQQLRGASPDRQAFLLQRAGLPNLTTRRGMEEFSGQVQEYFKQLPATGEGIPTPQRSTPSRVTKSPVPYKEEIEQDVRVTQVPATAKEGRPRRPGQASRIKQYTLSDSRLRTAIRMLRQMVTAGEKLSASARAAANYLNNRTRETFGQALQDLAFDLAMYELDPKHYGANSTFYGEGGKYAQDFRTWVEQNLDPGTVALLDELIQGHKETAQANAEFEQAVSEYNARLDAYKEKQRAAAKVPMPRAPKKSRDRAGEFTPEEEREEVTEPKVSRKNLPRVQGLYEIHPAIRRALEAGNTQQALQLLADSKSNPYYAMLAERLLEAGITAKTELISRDTIAPLNDTPEVRKTFDNFLGSLRELVTTTLPQERHTELLRLLDSSKLRDLEQALAELNNASRGTASPLTDAQIQLVGAATDFISQQYGWIGKYDPTSDTIFMRSGVGMTNHTFLHEVLHAATLGLLDRPDTLSGVRRQGYDKLVELYKHAKGVLTENEVGGSNIYGLTDLHEFVSEALTNPEFQALLRAIRYKASPFSMMNWFTDGIRKLFNIKQGRESNILNEAIFAADAMMLGGTAGKDDLTGPMTDLQVKSQAKGLAQSKKRIPVGRPNSTQSLRNYMTPRPWSEVKNDWGTFYRGLKSNLRPVALGALTLRQIADLVDGRIPQLDNFIRVVEDYTARKNRILTESGDITKRWQRLQAMDPEMSRKVGAVMHRATIQRIDPDKATAEQRNADPDLMTMWRELNPEAKQIYRDVRDFYARRFSEYKRTLRQRVVQMRQLGVSETTINEIRNEFEKGIGAGPYFPLMRYGRFWYQIGKGNSREYYMFETANEREAHIKQRLSEVPHLEATIQYGDDYMKGMDLHARESSFLKSAFNAVDQIRVAGPAQEDALKQSLKDELYQAWLTNLPETSFRNRFVHRSNVEGFSQDALRNFSYSSFHMAYQQARFEYSPEMFSQMTAARIQLKDRKDESDRANMDVMRENSELTDYVRELDKRLSYILNPEDTGIVVSTLSNIGFIWYLTSFASAATNILGGLTIGLPTLIGQQIRLNPNMSYTTATLKSLGQMKDVAAQILSTGFGLERGPRIRDNMVLFPSLDRAGLSRLDQAAYNRFVADGLIDITATYDQSGLASSPTESYDGIRNRVMTALAALFHNAERFNREVIAMSAFRAAMEKRANYPDQQRAFSEAIAEAKDVTTRSMFDYSTANKPRYMQHPAARVILQFKQFPQQMTFFLTRNFVNMVKKPSETQMALMSDAEREQFLKRHALMKREATARFVGTMGMTGILAGTTGLWGFSTAASIINAVVNGFGDDEDEPFDFELEYMNWAVNTFGTNLGMFLTRGAGNAAGVDLHSRVSLDNMWFRDGRKNLDEEDAWRQFLVDLLGPTVGLTVNVARAVDLYNQGHADRALEAVAPAFIKQPLIATRYAEEGVKSLRGDPLVENVGPFDLFMQSLGFRPAEIAEIQYYNIQKKGQEQEILKKRQNLLNLYGASFMSSDAEGVQKALEKMLKFNEQHPAMAIAATSLNRSVKQRLQKSTQAQHGLILNKRMAYLLNDDYVSKLSEEDEE